MEKEKGNKWITFFQILLAIFIALGIIFINWHPDIAILFFAVAVIMLNTIRINENEDKIEIMTETIIDLVEIVKEMNKELKEIKGEKNGI